MRVSFDQSLFVSSSIAVLALTQGAAFGQNQQKAGETVIVTGTRVQGMTAADSAAPITVLGSDALSHGTGSTDLRQQLGVSVPAFTAQQIGFDTAGLTLSAALRGLSPNDTLVLVNGHRRHYTGNLHVLTAGFSGGSSAPDLSLIPSAAIDHVEILLDGAAAQYGTDAQAGVVNIILKKKSSGGQFSATAGDYYDRGNSSAGIGNDGQKYDLSFNMGLPLFDKGFVNFTIDKMYQNFTQTGGPDERFVNNLGQPVPQSTVTGVGANGVANLSTFGVTVPNTFLPLIQGYPRNDPLDGNAEYQMTLGSVNAAYDFSDNVELYVFGTLSHKMDKGYEIDRAPDLVIATAGSNQPCSATNLVGYNTGSSTANGITPSCAGPFRLATANGFSATPGSPGAGLNPVTGQVVSSGNAGNLFSSTLINPRTGALLPSATGEPTLGTMPELVPFPNDFRPMDAVKEDDYQYNVGLKFNLAGWDADADVGYGKDIDNIYTYNSANRALFLDTHTTPTNFYDGTFTASQFIGTIDATHTYNVGFASPLTVAIGAEAREDTYRITQGEPASYYKEGVQSYPGFPPFDATDRSRKNYAVYVDFAAAPIEALQLDVAGRVEHYTDFGDTAIGKITARYDFNPKWAIRGTLSTGFRAPNLAEEFYTNVNVNPITATLQVPANSPAAKVLGLENLQPETSTSYSAGIVAHPLDDLSVTVDAYSIAIGKQITVSTRVTATGGSINTPLVSQAIALQGVTLDPTATSQGVSAFLNGISTLTQGVDMTINYPTDFGEEGLVNWTFAGNFNNTAVGKVAPVPAVLIASNPNASFFNFASIFAYAHAIPNWKMGLTADWSLDRYGATLRETFYGPDHAYVSPNANGELVPRNQADVMLTDLEARVDLTDQLRFSIGVNNLFDLRPDPVNLPFPSCSALPPGAIILPGGSCFNGPNQTNGALSATSSNVLGNPTNGVFDANGGYYYGRITFNF